MSFVVSQEETHVKAIIPASTDEIREVFPYIKIVGDREHISSGEFNIQIQTDSDIGVLVYNDADKLQIENAKRQSFDFIPASLHSKYSICFAGNVFDSFDTKEEAITAMHTTYKNLGVTIVCS